MIFCGQCGLQLSPGSTRCPRCGANVEETEATAGGEVYTTDDPTVASPTLRSQHQTITSNTNQQPLILGGPTPNPGMYSNTPDAYEATHMMESQQYQPGMPTTTNQGNSYPNYPGYPASASGPYPSTAGSYPDYSAPNNYANGTAYQNVPPQSQMGASYPDSTMQYQQAIAARNARGRTAGLIMILIGLLMILGSVIIFAMQQGMLS